VIDFRLVPQTTPEPNGALPFTWPEAHPAPASDRPLPSEGQAGPDYRSGRPRISASCWSVSRSGRRPLLYVRTGVVEYHGCVRSTCRTQAYRHTDRRKFAPSLGSRRTHTSRTSAGRIMQVCIYKVLGCQVCAGYQVRHHHHPHLPAIGTHSAILHTRLSAHTTTRLNP
jgi:hypothetical protein